MLFYEQCVGRENKMPHFIITLEAPNAPDLAEELSQRLLIKKLATEGFAVNSFETHAMIEFSSVLREFADVIDAEIADWIAYKHSTIKKRKLGGVRKRQSLEISDQATEQLVCIELFR
jgi:hypothetical protein